MALRFINVDLDIGSHSPLDHLCRDLVGHGMLLLRCGPHPEGFFARLETEEDGNTSDPDSIINCFCDALESMDGDAASEWKSAHLRCFDLGYNVTGSTLPSTSALSHVTLARVVALGASLAFTFYRHPEIEPGFNPSGSIIISVVP